MRWSCPHCQAALAIADERLGAGWTFARCYRCTGFSLVRQGEGGMLKVDQPPQVSARGSNPSTAQTSPTEQAPPRQEAQAPREASNFRSSFPEPLPLEPITRPWHYRALPFAIAGAGMFTLGTGAYLFLQGQAALQRFSHHSNARTHAPENHSDAGSSSPAVAAVLPTISAGAAPAGTAKDAAAVIIQKNQPNPAAAVATPIHLETHAALDTHKDLHGGAPARVRVASVTDQIQEQAMAPERKPAISSDHLASTSPLRVRIRFTYAHLHSGPGTSYPVIGDGKFQEEYAVAEWNPQWFKIVLPESPSKAAWVRNDLVQLLSNSN